MKRTMLFLTLIRLASAQAPTGAITGIVRDPSGAAVAGARVNAVNPATALTRSADTPEQGGYSFAALQAGEYEVSVEAAGFRRMVRQVLVEAGVTFVMIHTEAKGTLKNDDAPSPSVWVDAHR